MYRQTKDLKGYKLYATDDEFGSVQEVYFDSAMWLVRYLVADTRRWLPGRRVLISPSSITKIHEEEKHVHVNLSKDRIKNSPSVDEDKPVSRQQEELVVKYYDWPPYWTQEEVIKRGDPFLNSSKEVTGYTVAALNGSVGKIANILIDDAIWAVRYIVVDTGPKQVLLSTDWVSKFDESTKTVFVDVSKEQIEHAPIYHADDEISREIETQIYENYEKSYPWEA